MGGLEEMYDNLSSDDGLKETAVSENVSFILNELIHDYEDKLYTVRIQLKAFEGQLEIKEKEQYERELKKDNRSYFSPIEQNNDKSEKEIEDLRIQINSCKQQEKHISEIISALNSSIQCVNKCSTKNRKADEDIRKARINDIGLSILEAQEIERQRIARDLHDTTVQTLTSLVHKAELCIKLIDIDTIRAKLELNTMSNTLKAVINDMRGIIYNLKPMTIEDLGLTVTVQRYANKLMDLNNIDIIVATNEEPEKILPVIKLTVFRVIQEACCNILKHANATLIDINIHYEKNFLKVSVKDNGVGFDAKQLNLRNHEPTSSFGLSIMKERLSLLSGTLDIESEKGKGTTIYINVPLTNYEEGKNE